MASSGKSWPLFTNLITEAPLRCGLEHLQNALESISKRPSNFPGGGGGGGGGV